jgi:hypothetical protein
MESASIGEKIQRARYISVVPSTLKEIAHRLQFESDNMDGSKEMVFVHLTDDIVLCVVPEIKSIEDKNYGRQGKGENGEAIRPVNS